MMHLHPFISNFFIRFFPCVLSSLLLDITFRFVFLFVCFFTFFSSPLLLLCCSLTFFFQCHINIQLHSLLLSNRFMPTCCLTCHYKNPYAGITRENCVGTLRPKNTQASPVKIVCFLHPDLCSIPIPIPLKHRP